MQHKAPAEEAKGAIRAAKAAEEKAAKTAKAVSAEDAQTGRPSLCRDRRGLTSTPLQAARVLSQPSRGPLFYNEFQKTSRQRR